MSRITKQIISDAIASRSYKQPATSQKDARDLQISVDGMSFGLTTGNNTGGVSQNLYFDADASKVLLSFLKDLLKESKKLGREIETPIQSIFFGAPGTGKSFKIDDPEKGYGLKDVDESRKFRTTFHPDYDYAQFVGAYKPKKDGNAITYSFVPQVFAKAYAAAWKQYFAAGNVSTADNQVYLVIEEINRGNCAQIFGDIFQLLDRDSEGFSQYSIDADCDFAEWLKDNGVGDGKLKLPPNLNILATMNTSDQSLFPMDSAFKRRFDWEYVPINYKMPKADFKVGEGDLNFDWLHFLKKVNADIRTVTESEDKQMGEFFIKPKDNDPITLEEFRSKVLFYLWDTVYKDEIDKKNLFHIPYPEKGPSITFQRLFEEDEAGKISDNSKKIIRKMLETLDAAYDSEEYKDFKIFPIPSETN